MLCLYGKKECRVMLPVVKMVVCTDISPLWLAAGKFGCGEGGSIQPANLFQRAPLQLLWFNRSCGSVCVYVWVVVGCSRVTHLARVSVGRV